MSSSAATTIESRLSPAPFPPGPRPVDGVDDGVDAPARGMVRTVATPTLAPARLPHAPAIDERRALDEGSVELGDGAHAEQAQRAPHVVTEPAEHAVDAPLPARAEGV